MHNFFVIILTSTIKSWMKIHRNAEDEDLTIYSTENFNMALKERFIMFPWTISSDIYFKCLIKIWMCLTTINILHAEYPTKTTTRKSDIIDNGNFLNISIQNLSVVPHNDQPFLDHFFRIPWLNTSDKGP